MLKSIGQPSSLLVVAMESVELKKTWMEAGPLLEMIVILDSRLFSKETVALGS
jgi:hypothetical protein